jgi:RNA polymerase sigma-70 factor (ECF subfamily)
VGNFPTTVWTVIREAGIGRKTAQSEFVVRYRPAVVQFARFRGLDAAEAEDIAQEVFLALFDDKVLERADRALGRFRSLVLAVTRHVLSRHFEYKGAQRRGGGKNPVSLTRSTGEELDIAAISAENTRDSDFDREWLVVLLNRSLAKLKSENENLCKCLHAFLVEDRRQSEIAAAFGTTESAVRNAIYRGRARLSAILRDEVESYASSPGEFEDEVRYLQGLLDGSPAKGEKP